MTQQNYSNSAVNPICPSCGTSYPPGSSFCLSCGSPLQQAKTTNDPISTHQSSPYPSPSVPYYVTTQGKDRSTAMILEILPGMFGFLGIGWIYSGVTSKGVLILIGFLIWEIFAGFFTALTGGIAVICWLPVNIVCIFFSATYLNKYAKAHLEIFKP